MSYISKKMEMSHKSKAGEAELKLLCVWSLFLWCCKMQSTKVLPKASSSAKKKEKSEALSFFSWDPAGNEAADAKRIVFILQRVAGQTGEYSTWDVDATRAPLLSQVLKELLCEAAKARSIAAFELLLDHGACEGDAEGWGVVLGLILEKKRRRRARQ
jgi:hypothetical protein